MSCTGLKRKRKQEDYDEAATQNKMAPVRVEASPSYCVQRQRVLQLSMQKLCSVSSLGRRVLIANTLRLVQDQVSHQGASTFNMPAKESSDSAPVVSPEAGLTPAWVLEWDEAASLNEFEDLNILTNDLNEPQTITGLSEPHPDSAHTLSNHTPCSSALTFYPELALDDFLFSEIDSLLCEFNPYGSNYEPGSSSKVVSMVTDDLVRGLTTQPFRTDLNELERIMEVLVGS